MKLVIKIGIRADGRLGVNIVDRFEWNSGIRENNENIKIRDELVKNFGELFSESALKCWGYEITWKTKAICRNGIGVASLDFKEKKSCPPEILKYGRKIYEMLATPIEGEFGVD